MADYPEIVFNKILIQRVGDIGKVLGEFLDNQTEQVQKKLKDSFPNLPSNTVNRILNTFATLEGTKLPLHQDQIDIPGISDKIINFTLNELVTSRILRFEDETYELAHDTLAARIAEQRSAEDIALLEVTKLIKDRYEAFDNTHTYLNAKELQLVENYETKLIENKKLSDEELKFFRLSKQEVRNKKIIRAVYIIGTMLALAITAIWGWSSSNAAKRTGVQLVEKNKTLESQKDSINLQAERINDEKEKSDRLALVTDSLNRGLSNSIDEAKLATQRAIENAEIAEKRLNDLMVSQDSITQLIGALELQRDTLKQNKVALEKNKKELQKKYDELAQINRELKRQEDIAVSNRLKAEALLTLQRGDPTEAFKTAEYAWGQGDSIPIFPTFFNIYYNDFFSYEGLNLSTPFYRNLSYATENIKGVQLSPNSEDFLFIQDNVNEAILKSRLIEDKKIVFKHNAPVNSAVFSPDGRYIATASDDKSVKVWTWSDKDPLLLESYNDYQLEVNDVAFFHNSPLILIGSTDKNRLLEIKKYADLSRPILPKVGKIKSKTGIKKVAVSSDDKYIAAISSTEVFVLKTKEGLIYRDWKSPKIKEENNLFVDVFFSNDATKLYVFTRKTMYEFDVNRLKERNRLTFSQEVETVSRVQNSKYFAIGFRNSSEITLFEIESSGQKKIISLKGHSDQVRAVNMSLNGNYIISASNDRTINWWEIKGKPIIRIGKDDDVGATPVSSFYSTQYKRDSVIVFKPGGTKWWSFERLGNPEVAISPSGTHVVVLPNQGSTPSLWSVDSTGKVKEPFNLKGHNKKVNYAGFTPDGQFLVTGSADGSARIWDLEGNEIHSFRPGGNLIETWFTSRGDYLVTIQNTGIKHLWLVNSNSLVRIAQQIGIPDLQVQQKGRYDIPVQKNKN